MAPRTFYWVTVGTALSLMRERGVTGWEENTMEISRFKMYAVGSVHCTLGQMPSVVRLVIKVSGHKQALV